MLFRSAGNWPTTHDAVHSVFVNEEPDSMLIFVVSRPLKYSLYPSWVDASPMFFHRTSESPMMFQWYLFISWVSSSSLPASLNVRTFHVPVMMLLLALILLSGISVAHFPPPPWYTAEGAALCNPGDGRSGMGCVVVVIMWRI